MMRCVLAGTVLFGVMMGMLVLSFWGMAVIGPHILVPLHDLGVPKEVLMLAGPVALIILMTLVLAAALHGVSWLSARRVAADGGDVVGNRGGEA